MSTPTAIWRTRLEAMRVRTGFMQLLMVLVACAAFFTGAPSAATPEEKLARAQADLALSRATEARIAEEMARLEAAGELTDAQRQAYRRFLERVGALSAAHRQVVERMVAAGSPGTMAPGRAEASGRGGVPPIPEERAVGELERLENDFRDSLAAFDDRLLAERNELAQRLDRIRTESDARLTQLAQEAARAAGDIEKGTAGQGGRSGENGPAGRQGESGRGRGREPTGRTGESGRGGPSTGEESGGNGDAQGSGGGVPGESGEPGSASGRSPQRDFDPDDDIVARQIREAAEKETDPELKEKLWREYDAYKKSRGQ